MRRLRILLAPAPLGLAVPFAAHGMPLSDPPGDVPRRDVDIVGGQILLRGGNVVVKFKLADFLKRRDVYVVHIFGRRGEHWLLRAVRTSRVSLTARDLVRHRRAAATGVMVDRLVEIRFPAARVGAARGVFRLSLSAAAPGRRRVLDPLPARGRPPGTALIPYRRSAHATGVLGHPTTSPASAPEAGMASGRRRRGGILACRPSQLSG